jgi:hypothetical protein
LTVAAMAALYRGVSRSGSVQAEPGQPCGQPLSSPASPEHQGLPVRHHWLTRPRAVIAEVVDVGVPYLEVLKIRVNVVPLPGDQLVDVTVRSLSHPAARLTIRSPIESAMTVPLVSPPSGL